jgi:hypothetical protein
MKLCATMIHDDSNEKLPEEIIRNIFSLISWQDAHTICSIMLICKKGFEYIQTQCKVFLMTPPTLASQWSQEDDLSSIFTTIKSNEIYFNRENMYFLYRLIYDIACYDDIPPLSVVHEYVLSETYVIDRMNHSLIPLKNLQLKIEEFQLPDLKLSQRVVNEVEGFALEQCHDQCYTKVLKFYIFQKETKIVPSNDNTLISNLLIDDIPFYSENYTEKRKSFVFKEKNQSIMTYFRNTNLNCKEGCCILLGIEYKCDCDYHDIHGCTYHEYG